MVNPGRAHSGGWPHASFPKGNQDRYKPDDEWPCLACGMLHRFSLYTLRNWAMPLVHSCDCGAKWLLQRGIVRGHK